MFCLIDKSSEFCNTRNKYEQAITRAFGRRPRMNTISAVPTCTYMLMRATLRKYWVLKCSIWFLEVNAANSVYMCVLRA